MHFSFLFIWRKAVREKTGLWGLNQELYFNIFESYLRQCPQKLNNFEFRFVAYIYTLSAPDFQFSPQCSERLSLPLSRSLAPSLSSLPLRILHLRTSSNLVLLPTMVRSISLTVRDWIFIRWNHSPTEITIFRSIWTQVVAQKVKEAEITEQDSLLLVWSVPVLILDFIQ